MSSPIRSTSADSPTPVRRNVRATRVAAEAALPAAGGEPRRATSATSRAAVRAAPRSRVRRDARPSQPGAEPRLLASAVAPSISHACFRFASGISMPRRSNRPRSHASSSGSTVGSRPHAAAMASRVRSSGVGPRPPVETTRSAASSARWKADVTSAEIVGQRDRPAHPRPRDRSAPAPARRCSCRACRRWSARCPRPGSQRSRLAVTDATLAACRRRCDATRRYLLAIS